MIIYVNDHLGTPQKLIQDNGVVVWAAQHESFGKAEVTVDIVENPLRFPGQYFDEETGYHYNYFRDYDPGLGRYVQSDPIGLKGGRNTYAYVNENPISSTDPLGLINFNLCAATCVVWATGYCRGPWALASCALCGFLPPPANVYCLTTCIRISGNIVTCIGLYSSACILGCGIADQCIQ